MGAELFRKYVSSSMIICYRSVVRHPFLVGMVLILISMHRLFPSLFSLLVSASPVIVSTAVLLGTLLSLGQPNIPEIEKEHKSEEYEIQKLESKVTSDTEIVGRDVSFASEETIEVGDKSFGEKNPVNDDNSFVEVDRPVDLVDNNEFVTEEKSEKLQVGEEHLVEEAKNETDEVKVVLGSHYSPLQQSEDENIVGELESGDKLWEGSADPLNSDPGLLWKRVEGDDDDDDDEDYDDDESDSGSDLAESSSPDASMADIIPMLDELHPLLSEEPEIHQAPLISHDGTDVASEHSIESSDSSSESNDDDDDDDDIENNKHLEIEDEEEDKESKHADKEEETTSAITWTEDDQKNLMNLGTSEMERNRRLENLIARRRARKTMRMQAEKNLIDFESADDLPWNISPISTARKNPFDYDSNDNIPGSAPSVLLKRRNPFDLPYDPNEEKPDLVGDTFQQEFTTFQPKEPFFRRHESFNVGPSNFGALRSERQETKLRPYFVPERIASDETSFSSFQRQLSEISDSKVSSVPDTESVSSDDDHDHENKNHIEDDHSLEPELVSEKDQEHEHPELISESDVSHQRPYFVPEHVDLVGTSFLSYERQVSGVSDSKMSSVSSAGDLENDHIDLSQEAELISLEEQVHGSGTRDHLDKVSEVVSHGSESFEDDGTVEFIQDERTVEAEISVENVTNQEDAVHSSGSSLSSLDEVSEQMYNEKEGDDEVATSVSEATYYFVEDGNSIERSEEIDVTSLVVKESQPEEPVYDLSPRSVTRNLSSSSICNNLQAEVSDMTASHQEEVISQPEEELSMSGRSMADPSARDPEELQVQELQEDEVTSSNSEAQFIEVVHGETYENPDSTHHEFGSEEEALSQSQKESPLLDTSTNEPLQENLESLQVQELQQDEVTSLNSEEQLSEVVHGETYENPELIHHHFVSQEEAISQESPLLDNSANEPSEDNPELLQINLLIQEPDNSVLNAEPDLVEVDDVHDNIDVVDKIDEFDEDLLVELDAVGDFNVNDLGPTMKEGPHAPDHVLETNHSADEDSCSKDLGSVLKDMEEDPHALEHDDLETGDEDSYSKDLGSVLDEMEQPPHTLEHDLETKEDQDSCSKELGSTLDEIKEDPPAMDHDLETKHSGDADSYSKDSGSVLDDEMEQPPHTLEHDLETKIDQDSCSKELESSVDEMKEDPRSPDLDLEINHSENEDSYSRNLESTLNEKREDPEDLGHHNLETFYSVDEYAFSKIVESTLTEIKQEPQTLDHVLETNPSGDEDLYPTDPLKLEAESMEAQNQKVVNNGTDNASSTTNTDKE